MKRIILTLGLILSTLASVGQPGPSHQPGRTGGQEAERKFEMLVKAMDDAEVIDRFNASLEDQKENTRSIAANYDGTRSILSDMVTGFSSSFVTKSLAASSSILDLGVSYMAEALQGKQDDWLKAAQSQCSFTHKLASNVQIDDFYATGSVKGAMDPANMKFEGFGCRNYLECKSDPSKGKEVFYVFCKLRKDSLGIAKIVNHSKFAVELDRLVFNPYYCNLPNDTTGRVQNRFDFSKRNNLTLTIKTKIFSSWVNEAIMMVSDQQLGEFDITLRIDDESMLTDSLFIFDKNNPKHLAAVSVTGDSFIIPRSFTGTSNGLDYTPAWGTGQFRIEMTIYETCNINEDYYLEPDSANERNKRKKKWDNDKWKPEWKQMSRKGQRSFFQEAFSQISSEFKGSGWVQTFTSPITETLYNHEVEVLKGWTGISTLPSETVGGSASSGGGKEVPSAGGGHPSGGIQGGAGKPK